MDSYNTKMQTFAILYNHKSVRLIHLKELIPWNEFYNTKKKIKEKTEDIASQDETN